ncbi:MAG TPA: LLM class flavin-dependent oxidoreductase [Candidatus Binataceae bacterium]|jgi:alkanesulfonate monooxygenase SsuD/methylene tetrahydromethanopterin reductase-like flavin-dependent oxidoreductase (luciferase family)|nr:LLM class flavin-dependent oxidoreductase [Candidatus Binataceae bacterium]
MAQLAIVLMPGSQKQMEELAREAEDAGFAGACMPELTNDGLMCCYVMATATKKIRLITWIVNVYFRHPWLCAAAAAMVQDVSGGRLTLGLGVSHRPFMEALGIDMGNARDKLRSFTVAIRKILNGEMSIGVPARKPKTPIPIYYGALALETARLAGELADGVEFYMCPADRLRKLADAARQTAVKNGRKASDIAVTVGIPTFVDDDLTNAYETARHQLAFYPALPFYNRQLARSGFEAEAKAAMEAATRGDQKAQVAALSNRLLDAVALVGPPARCIERLAAFREAGAELPIIAPGGGSDPVGNTRRLMKIFSKAI